MKVINIENLKCECVAYPATENILYLLLPVHMRVDNLLDIANHFGTNVVAVTGIDWNEQLTPWSNPTVIAGEADFGDGAQSFLDTLQSKVLPVCERVLGTTAARRTLAGVSLAGLFAVWAWEQTDAFADIVSLSGSFWYPGFVEWLSENAKERTGRVYLGLGEQEALNTKGVFGTVGTCTERVADILHNHGAEVESAITPGNHFAPLLPRIIAALPQASAEELA